MYQFWAIVTRHKSQKPQNENKRTPGIGTTQTGRLLCTEKKTSTTAKTTLSYWLGLPYLELDLFIFAYLFVVHVLTILLAYLDNCRSRCT